MSTTDKLEEVRRQIADGTYETPYRIQATAARLLDALEANDEDTEDDWLWANGWIE